MTTFHRVRTNLITATILLLTASLNATAQDSVQVSTQDSTVLTYEEDVRWALVRTCFECHSGGESRGELLLDSYDSLMEGGEHGPPIVPGSPEKSILYQKLHPDPPFGKMMPRKRGLVLSQLELDMIRTWIEQGAKRTRHTAEDSE